MSKRLHAIAVAAAALAALPAQAAPGTIIAPLSGVVDVGGPGFGSLTNTFNQAGLSTGYTAGVTNFDAYIASNPLHTTAFGCCEFFGNTGIGTLTVTYDLGAATRIDRLALWNEESSGIGLLNLLGSLDGITFTSLASGLVPTDHALTSYPADVFSFAATNTRYVRFEASRCPQPIVGSFPACAIGEVAFRTAAVPEPQSWALLIAGFGLVGATLRRRRSVLA